MRASCRKFLDEVGHPGLGPSHNLRWRGYGSWGDEFSFFLGELRGVFGVHVAQIAAVYQIDVDDELATILPPVPEG